MYEFELRAKILDKDLFLSNLLMIGCTLDEAVLQEDLIYIHKSVSPVLRIRKENSHNILTVKTLQENRNTAKEYEVVFDDYENMKEILKQFGFNEPIKLTKTRRTTSFKGFSITFDSIEELGYFVEVETLKKDEINAGFIYDEIKKILFVLGILEDSITEKKYYEMLMDKRLQ